MPDPIGGHRENGLSGARVVLVGAGSTGALAGSLLRRAGVGQLVIANRSVERARRLAAKLDGRALSLDALDNELQEADLVVTATGATLPVISAEAVAHAMARAGRSRARAAGSRACRATSNRRPRAAPASPSSTSRVCARPWPARTSSTDVDAVRALVAEEVASYLDRQRALRVAPTVAALRARAAEMVAASSTGSRGGCRSSPSASAPRWPAPCGGSSTSCCTLPPSG